MIFQYKEDSKTRPGEAPAIQGESKEEKIDSIVKNVNWQMDIDRKAKPLKQLQGHMWIHAYESGSIKGQ